MIGHTLTAAGAIEAVVSLLTIQHGRIPPTINYTYPTRPSRSTWWRAPATPGSSGSCRTRSASAARTLPRPGLRTRMSAPTQGRVLVTGGASGLGAAIVRALCIAGHDVTFTYRSSAGQAEALVAELAAAHPDRTIRGLPLDLADRAALTAFCERLDGRPGTGSFTMPANPTTRWPPCCPRTGPRRQCRSISGP